MTFLERNNSYRIRVSIELVLIMMFACYLLDIKSLRPFIQNNMNVVSYLLLLIIVYIRNMGFSFKSGIASKLKPLWWLIIGVLISFIPAYLYYGQHLYHSVTVYRHFLGYFAFFLFLSIQPSRTELKIASYVFSVIYILTAVYGSLIDTSFFYIVPDSDSEFIADGEFIHHIPGDQFLMLAYIFALNDIRNNKMSPKLFAVLIATLGMIFLTQSRTLLFSALVIGIFSAMANRSARQRLTIGTLVIVTLSVAVLLAWNYVDLLITETIDQLTDQDYNRVKAITYFFSVENGTMSCFWGNGFISGKVHPIMEQLRQEGIFHSDLGLIGFWHQFGLIAVITILTTCIKGLSPMRSFEVRANALNIILCSFTIAYFRDFGYSLWLCLYWYLYSIDPQYDINKRIHDAQVAKQAMKRFRSIQN